VAELHGEHQHCGYPCQHVPTTSARPYRQRQNRTSRTKLRTDLAAGREPSTDQHRHHALWDAW